MSQQYFYPSNSSSNASVGTNGSPAPTSSTEIAFIDGSNNLQPVTTTNPLPTTATLTGTGNVNLIQVGGSAISEGQKTMAASLPIVIASDQSAIAVTASQATASSLNATVVGTTAAGSGAASGLMTVQGNASGTPVPVSGTVTANNASVASTGSSPPASATYVGINIAGNLTGLTGSSAGLRVDGSGATQPISGTVTANQGNPPWTILGNSAAAAPDGGANPVKVGALYSSSLPTYVSGNRTDLQADINGKLIVTQTSLPLPTGASTSALQSSVQGSAAGGTAATSSQLDGGIYNSTPPTLTNGQQASLQLNVSGALKTDASATTQPVSGTVTANAGTNLNTSALALDTSVNGILVSQGSTTSGEKGTLIQGAVTTAAPSYTTAQTSPLSLTTTGALRTDASASTQPVSGTVTANQGTSPWVNNVTQFGGTNLSTGTGASGTGIPRVTVANDSNILATQSGTWNINNVSGTISLPTGAASSSNQTSVIGTVAAGTAATNALLTGGVFNTSLPTLTNGQQAALQLDSTGHLFVVSSASTSSTSTLTNVASSASSVSILASNANRKGMILFNDSTATLYLKFGTTASATSYTVQIASNGYFEMPNPTVYTGALDGIWSSANGNARVTELT